MYEVVLTHVPSTCCISVVNKNYSALSFTVSIDDFHIQSMSGVYAGLFKGSIHFIPYMPLARLKS